MEVEQLFVATLKDIDKKMRSDPDEYQLLKVAGLLRPILIENLLDQAAAAAPHVDVKFRVVQPGPLPIPPDVQAFIDAQWAKLHATNPEIPRVDVGAAVNPGLLSSEPRNPRDQVLELGRKDFLTHAFIIYNDAEFTVEHTLLLVANSLGGTHFGNWNSNPQANSCGTT